MHIYFYRAFAGLAALAMGAGSAAAQAAPSTQTLGEVERLVKADSARLEAIFKDLHQHPELGFEEVRSSAILIKELKALGFQVQTGIGKTGFAAILKNGEGPVVMYRADMDANTLKEATGLPYASNVKVTRPDGSETYVAHACGHDAHMVWMLGMAKALTQMKSQWKGTLVLVGQPAEELILGAQAMVDDGLYARLGGLKPDYLLGIHAAPLPVGAVVSAGGPKMAGSDQIDVRFKGVGGHGSSPNLAKDPVVMAATAILQYQTLVSRTAPPMETAVLTVGSVQAGASNNVIPNEALLKLNLRWYDPKVRTLLVEGIERISQAVARSYDMPEADKPEIIFKGSTTPLINDPELAARLADTLKLVVGEKGVITQMPPVTGSEDVHLLMGPHKADVKFNYMVVGVADPALFEAAIKAGKTMPYAPHTPNFKVDLAAIPIGAKVATAAMLEVLGR